MWEVDDQDWKRLEQIATAECSKEQKQRLKKIIDASFKTGRISTILIQKGELSRSDIDQIFELLPEDANFYEFSQHLRFKPRSFDHPKPSDEFVALTQKLRRESDRREYSKMVSSVDSTQNYGKVNYVQDFGKEMKEVNRQMIAIFNTLITVAGAFAFGFYGISFAYPALSLTFETRIVMGLCAATVVFFADLYFIAKSMDAHPQQKNEGSTTYTLNTKEIGKTSLRSSDDDNADSRETRPDEETVPKQTAPEEQRQNQKGRRKLKVRKDS